MDEIIIDSEVVETPVEEVEAVETSVEESA